MFRTFSMLSLTIVVAFALTEVGAIKCPSVVPWPGVCASGRRCGPRGDTDCPGDSKCCSMAPFSRTGCCSKLVIQPQCPPVISVPDQCRLIFRVIRECSDMNACAAGLTCCRSSANCRGDQCLNLSNTQNSRCYISVSNPLPKSCSSASIYKPSGCQTDADCNKGSTYRKQICCPDRCGIQTCKPVPWW